MGVRGDMRMLGTAIRGRWLTEDQKPIAMRAIEAGLKDDDPRVQQTAVKNLIAMEAQNQKDEHSHLNDFAEQIIAIAIECGIDIGALGVIDAAGGSAARGIASPVEEPER